MGSERERARQLLLDPFPSGQPEGAAALEECQPLAPGQKERAALIKQKSKQEVSKQGLGVLSHHLKCEMKSPHLVDFG